MKDHKFPKGWDEQKVRDLIQELDARTEDEWVAADEAAIQVSEGQSVIAVPSTLLPEIRRLIAAHRAE